MSLLLSIKLLRKFTINERRAPRECRGVTPIPVLRAYQNFRFERFFDVFQGVAV